MTATELENIVWENMNKDKIIEEIDQYVVDKFDEHIQTAVSVHPDPTEPCDVTIFVKTLNGQEFYDFSLFEMIKNDKTISRADWAKRLDNMAWVLGLMVKN